MNSTTDLSLGMESNIRYPLFYRKTGVRMPMQLVMPVLNPIAELSLPMASVLHYVSEDESQFGIAQDEQILKDNERLIMVEHVSELADVIGNPIPVRVPPGQMIRAYHRKYRMTRPLVNFSAADSNPRTVIVENYALLPHLNRYLNNYFRPFNKWWNIYATVFTRVGKIAAISERQQYLICAMPQILPTLPQLQRAAVSQNRQTLEPFRSPEARMMLELFKWLGSDEERAASVLSKAPVKAMDKLNLIFIDGDRWFVINLGLLNQWRKSVEYPNAPVEPMQLQRRFLRLGMTLMATRTGGAMPPDEADLEIDKTTTAGKSEQPVAAKPAAPIKAKVDSDHGNAKHIEIFKDTKAEDLPDDESKIKVDMVKVDEQIEADLKQLETISDTFEKALQEGRQEEIGGTIEQVTEFAPKIEYSETAKVLSDGIVDLVNDLAETGTMSAGEYRRLTGLAVAYKTAPNPYNDKETIEQGMKVEPKDLIIDDGKISKVARIPDKPGVIDKSMLEDSLRDFDNSYVDKVMPKDTLGMVMNLQRAGVAVTDYQIEETEDALNLNETHVIKLVPVRGKESTIRFMVPKIQKDGTFLAGGVKCRMRKQRGDQNFLIL